MSEHRTSHQHLMDLASRWSYDPRLEVRMEIDVAGSMFVVEHAATGTPTGLDAFMLRNIETGERTIAFQGTADLKDGIADAQLLTQRIPPQFEAAAAYVEQMRARYPGVASVCGNSLGGGLAAYVALLNPDLTAVTVNPAPVPEAFAGVDAPNVHNYISTADILFRFVQAADLDDRIVGNRTSFEGTSRNAAFIVANHIGSDRGDPEVTPYNGSMTVPFSLFHADVVLGAEGFGDRVRIDPDALEQMAIRLDRQRESLRVVVRCELDGLREAMWTHARDLPLREATARRDFVDAVAENYLPARRLIDQLGEEFRAEVRSPLDSLPPVPLPLQPAWTLARAPLDAGRQKVAQALDALREFAVRGAATGVWDMHCAPLFRESEVISAGLAARCDDLLAGLSLVDDKWSAACAQSRSVASEMELADMLAAAGIGTGRWSAGGGTLVRAAWPPGRVDPLGGNLAKRFTQVVVETRQTVTGEVVLVLGRELAEVLRPFEGLCTVIDHALAALEVSFATAARSIRSAIWVLQRTGPGILVEVAGFGDDVRRFSEAVEDASAGFAARIGLMRDLVRALRVVLQDLPDGVEELRPFFHESVFADAVIEEAYDALLKCRNIADRSRTSFGEVDHQLADHEAWSVDELAANARDLGTDLSTTVGSLRTMLA